MSLWGNKNEMKACGEGCPRTVSNVSDLEQDGLRQMEIDSEGCDKS